MLVRLLVALLTLALALPAMAMPLCHAPEASAMPVVEHAGHGMAMTMSDDPAPEAPTKANPHADAMCIGCIAPSTVRPPIVAARLFDASARVFVPVATGAALGDRPPATPPPRLRG
ncbi:hypothetical protein ACX0GZ_07785 [Sphingomonas aestuarii]